MSATLSNHVVLIHFVQIALVVSNAIVDLDSKVMLLTDALISTSVKIIHHVEEQSMVILGTGVRILLVRIFVIVRNGVWTTCPWVRTLFTVRFTDSITPR